MKNFSLIIFLLLIIPSGLIAQEKQEKKEEPVKTGVKPDKPQPNSWRGLVLDEATPEMVIAKFGQPKRDVMGGYINFLLDKLLIDLKKGKKVRRLTYEKLEGLKYVDLCFYEGKLIDISLYVDKQVDPNTLEKSYGLAFKPMFSGFTKSLLSDQFERNQGKTYAITYPDIYHLLAVSDKSYVSASISNGGFRSQLKQAYGIPDQENQYPGKVEVIQLTSKSLEKPSRDDLLK